MNFSVKAKNKNLSRVSPLIAALFVLCWSASCGGLSSHDANGNLPQKQNTNLPIPPPAVSATPVPTAAPEITPTPANENVSTNVNLPVDSPYNVNVNVNASNLAPVPTTTTGKLIIPVAGVKPENLLDTFKDARSENRVHDAIDIMAAGGTPVLAAADGEIARFFDSERGGITVYQFSLDKKMMYYYAHLQRRAETLQEHQFVRQGTVIGYVGDTGNAGAGNFHLHFAVWIIDDPKRYWEGTNINPYPLLRR